MRDGPCGVIFQDYTGIPHDRWGCRLPSGHAGPHEFVDVRADVWRWETDWSCTCEECLSGDADFCSIFWRVTDEPPSPPDTDRSLPSGQDFPS